MATLRRKPAYFARWMGLDETSSEIRSSVMAASSSSGGAKWRGSNAGSWANGAREFHGQTSWQISQPKMCWPMPVAHLFRRRAMQFDREVRDAAPGIDFVAWRARWPAWDKRRCSACRCRSDRAAGNRDRFERSQDLAQEHPRTDLLIDQAGVLADPAEAGLARVGALQQGRGVDADFVFMIAAELRCQLSPDRGA